MTAARVLFVALVFATGSALAQTFPSKSLRIIVPFAAGGAADIASRQISDQLSKGLGQPVIVDNRPGAGAVIGYELGAKAAPDGHTMTIVFPSFVINPAIRRVGYDPLKDYRAVSQAISLPMAIAVHPSLPAKNLKELIAIARTKPKELSYGTPGVGTLQHALGELIGSTLKIQLTHVPYAGCAPASTAAAGGHIMSTVCNVVELTPFVPSKLRPIVVSTSVRAEQFPDVQTFREAGYPELEATNWAGFVVPAATPAAAITRLNAELTRVLALKDVQEKLKAQGMNPAPGTPDQFQALLQSESARYGKVVRAAGITAE